MKFNKLFYLKLKGYFSYFLLFLKILGINNFFDFDFISLNLNENENENENENNNKLRIYNMIIAAIRMSTPLRHYIYALIAFSICSSSDSIDESFVLAILATIEIIDKSIITLIEEMYEEELEKRKNK